IRVELNVTAGSIELLETLLALVDVGTPDDLARFDSQHGFDLLSGEFSIVFDFDIACRVLPALDHRNDYLYSFALVAEDRHPASDVARALDPWLAEVCL